jgi:hypothetical protein
LIRAARDGLGEQPALLRKPKLHLGPYRSEPGSHLVADVVEFAVHVGPYRGELVVYLGPYRSEPVVHVAAQQDDGAVKIGAGGEQCRVNLGHQFHAQGGNLLAVNRSKGLLHAESGV